MIKNSILIAFLISLSALFSSISQAKVNESRSSVIVKDGFILGTEQEFKEQVASMYDLLNLRITSLAQQRYEESQTENEKALNICVDLFSVLVARTAFEIIPSIPNSKYVQGKIEELSQEGHTEQTKEFCKANFQQATDLYIKYLNEIL